MGQHPALLRSVCAIEEEATTYLEETRINVKPREKVERWVNSGGCIGNMLPESWKYTAVHRLRNGMEGG